MDVSLSKLQQLVMDREAWYAAVHGVAKSHTQLNWTEPLIIFPNSNFSSCPPTSFLRLICSRGPHTFCCKFPLIWNCPLKNYFLKTISQWKNSNIQKKKKRERERIVGRTPSTHHLATLSINSWTVLFNLHLHPLSHAPLPGLFWRKS